MNPRLLYDLLSALHKLQSGRTQDGTAALAEAIREHAKVPVPDPPLWMRAKA